MEDLTPHVVITGASSGIGQAAAIEMARRGWRVTLVGRSRERLGPAGLVADFTELAQVHELAHRLKGQRIDVLANNAGLIKRGSTVDGFDATMQVNHLAPFLLSHLLREQLPDGARIVNTSSAAWAWGADPTPPGRRFPSAWLAYSTSKKANILFADEATRRWPTLRSYSFHPGVVRTRFGTPGAKLWYKLAPGLSTPEQGADQLVWLSTAPAEELVNGAYYVDRRPVDHAKDEAAASRLWDATASLLALV
ncbi:MAG TPA: short-chain dehydrogenase [Micromonosporaceae bacterium]|nr:short-chain dehydrogenase [Micromonosporaceae bacterium]